MHIAQASLTRADKHAWEGVNTFRLLLVMFYNGKKEATKGLKKTRI